MIFANVWEALEDNQEDVHDMILRSELMRSVTNEVERRGWSPVVTAEQLGEDGPEAVDALLSGDITRFSAHRLMSYCVSLGLRRPS